MKFTTFKMTSSIHSFFLIPKEEKQFVRDLTYKQHQDATIYNKNKFLIQLSFELITRRMKKRNANGFRVRERKTGKS